MNILILSWRGPRHPLAGGAEIATYEHAKAWVNNGNKVILFTSYFEGAKEIEVIDGIKIIRRGGDAFGVKIAAFFWYLFKNHLKFDLVVDEFHGIPFFTPIYVRTKRIAFIHEVAKEVWWLNPWPKLLNYIPGIVGYLFEPLIFKLFYKNTQFMTVSESTKRDLINWGISKDKIEVIHNGVNVTYPKTKKETRKTAIFLGTLAKDKGIEDALKSFSLMNKSQNTWQFWVVGGGSKDYLMKLKGMCRELGIETKTRFWGHVSEKEKFELLFRSHIFINPSIREGWGLVNIEANSMGTPVVGYNVPGIRDSVVDGKTGILVEFGDYKQLASRAVNLCSDLHSYNLMCKNAISWSKKFTWKNSTEKSSKLINSLVS